jgi:hypothetical protein
VRACRGGPHEARVGVRAITDVAASQSCPVDNVMREPLGAAPGVSTLPGLPPGRFGMRVRIRHLVAVSLFATKSPRLGWLPASARSLPPGKGRSQVR